MSAQPPEANKKKQKRAKRSAVVRREIKLKIQEFSLKGYTVPVIQKMINLDLAQQKQKPIHTRTVWLYLKEMENETAGWYLHLVKDQMAYVILHRRKLLALDLQAQMIHDKIAAEGGISFVKTGALNNFVRTLKDITMSQAELEKEIPNINSVITKKVKTPEEVKAIEAEIVQGLPNDLRAQYEKIEKEKRERLLAAEGSEEGLDLSEYPKDTFIV